MTPFVIWFQHRSGSTHLVSLLNSHPEVKCKGEIFGCFRLGNLEQRLQFPNGYALGESLYRRVLNLFPGKIEDPQDIQCLQQLEDFVFARQSHTDKIRGFKFKFPSQAKLFELISHELCARASEIKLICLTRKNLLRRAISVLNLGKIQELSHQANVRTALNLPPAVYDIQEVVRLISYYERIDREFLDWPLNFPNRLDIEYQELVDHQSRVCLELQRFIGVSEERELVSKTHRITATDLEKQVLNMNELRQVLEEQGFSRFLD